MKGETHCSHRTRLRVWRDFKCFSATMQIALFPTNAGPCKASLDGTNRTQAGSLPNRRVSTKAHDELRGKHLQQPRHQGLQFGEFPDAKKATRPGRLLGNPRVRVLS